MTLPLDDDLDPIVAQERRQRADAVLDEMLRARESVSRDWIPGSANTLRLGQRAMLWAPYEGGKSWAALQLALQVMDAEGEDSVQYVDLENGRARMEERVDLLTASGWDEPDWLRDEWRVNVYTDNFEFRQLRTPGVMESFQERMRDRRLWVIDSLSRVLGELGLRESSNEDFSQFMGRYVDPIAQAGTAVVMLDNTGHKEDHVRGASNKTDLVELAYKVTGGQTCTPQKRGTIRLVRTRSRDADEPRELTMELGGKDAPTKLTAEAADSPKSRLHERVVEVLAESAPSKRQVEGRLRDANVKGIPHKGTLNEWLDDWADDEHSPIQFDGESWYV